MDKIQHNHDAQGKTLNIKRTAAQTAIFMAVLVLFSKLLGFIREMVMANFFGASFVVDAYVMAIAIPGILFGGIFASVAIAYMPIYSKIREGKGQLQGDRFTSEVLNLLFIIGMIVCVIGFLFSEEMVAIMAKGFSGETAKLTTFFLKITFAYTFFSAAAGVLEAYLQYKGVFLSQIFAGYMLSLMSIVFIIISALYSYYFLAFGMFAGMTLRFIIDNIIAKRKKFQYTFTFKVDSTVKSIAALAIPVFIGNSIQQINTFVDKSLASQLQEGSIAALNYGMLLITLVTSLTIGIFTTIIYPKITQANAQEDFERFNQITGQGITLILMVSIPFSLGGVLYNNQVVQIVYERGAFDPLATLLTAGAFGFYALGLVFLATNEFLTKIYYAMHDMKLPMIFGGISVAINIFLNLIFVKTMAHSGLALATSIAFASNSVLLICGMKFRYPQIQLFPSKLKLLKIFISALMAVGVSYIAYTFVILPNAHIIYMRVVQLGITALIAGMVYLGLLLLFKVEDLKILKTLVRRAS